MDTRSWLLVAATIFLIAGIVTIFLILRSRKIDHEIQNELMDLLSSEEGMITHRHSAYAEGVPSNPNRTIAEAMTLLRWSACKFDESIKLSSAYYGQVSHLIAIRKYIDALIYFMKAWSYAEKAIAHAKRESVELSSSQIEVLYARYYMMAIKLPVIGRLLFGNKAQVALEKALERCDVTERITKGLILGKLYDVSHDLSDKLSLMVIGLTRADDPKDIRRIARSVGMSLEEFYSFLGI